MSYHSRNRQIGTSDVVEPTVSNVNVPVNNPIVEIGLIASSQDNWSYEISGEPYVGLYHLHEDGTAMIGEGVLGVVHELKPDEIIIQLPIPEVEVDIVETAVEPVSYETVQEVREIVSDLFYKLWFESNTLTDNQILSMQTTIRDGKKQTGRGEDEPLVFYKKDRNTLENRDDLQGEVFEEVCQSIYQDNLPPEIIEQRFTFTPPVEEPYTSEFQLPVNQYYKRKRYNLRYESLSGQILVIAIANELILYENVPEMSPPPLERDRFFTDILNLSQLTKPKFGSRIDSEKAREVLDTNIFELLPNQTTRQDEINDFFTQFDDLIGPTPVFQDPDDDGAGEDIQNYEQDEQSRISFENQPNAFITRLDEQAEGSSINQGKTLESMRNRLNTYLGDVDNVIQTLEDDRPDYQNISDGFLKIRKPNQAIIIRAPGNDLLEFQKINPDTDKPSYLEDGFTITMWVRFVSKTSEGTLFNFGNPLEENGSGFRLETRTSIDSVGNYRRWIRLVVKDDYVRDNHFGDTNAKRRPVGLSKGPLEYYLERNFHKLYPNIPNDDLNEWYFICATYNPQVVEAVNLGDDNPLLTDKEYWLNHKIYYNISGSSSPFIPVGNRNDIVANSLEGARCKVEIISRSDLLRARGFKVDDLTVDAPAVDGLAQAFIIGENGDGNGVGGGDGNNGIEPSVGGVDDIINPSSEPPSEQSSEEETEEEIERPLEEREEEETSSPTITIRSSGGGY